MDTQELQSRAQQIINAVLQGRPVEDTRIEVKSIWIKAHDAVRRLAGQTDAVRGESIIWILGVDEKSREVTGVEATEMSSWIKSLEKHFDGDALALATHTNIHIQNKTVVALCFETHLAAPFVIKNMQGGLSQV